MYSCLVYLVVVVSYLVIATDYLGFLPLFSMTFHLPLRCEKSSKFKRDTRAYRALISLSAVSFIRAHHIAEEMATERKTLDVVAKHLRFKLPTKAAVLRREKVEYFTGSAAVDLLMNSKWAREKGEATKTPEDESTPAFYTRMDAVNFCNRLLVSQFMVRVNKVEVKPNSSADAGDDESADEPKQSGKKKRRKRYRLEVHSKQQFRDSDDLFIWKYNPPSMSTYVIGFIVVLGAIAWTLQPLWPASTRVGMWYIAIAAACVIGALLALLVVRWILFGIVTVVTLGKVQFWIFPNLNEEKYGFFDSFKPFYSIETFRDSEQP